MTMSIADLNYAVDEGVTEVMFSSFFEGAMMWPNLLGIRNSTGAYSEQASFGDLGLYAKKTETSAVATDSISQQFKQKVYNATYAKSLPFSMELASDQRWPVIERFAEQLGAKGMETIEYYAATLLTDSFTGATYLGEDELSLCNDAHVDAAGNNSQDNSFTNSLDNDGVKSCRNSMRDFRSYDGTQRLNINPNELWVPLELEDDALIVIGSSLRPGTNNNDDNVHRGKYTVYSWHWLTSSTQWWMADGRLREKHAHFQNRETFQVVATQNFSNLTRSITAWMRWAIAFDRWYWIAGNAPS